MNPNAPDSQVPAAPSEAQEAVLGSHPPAPPSLPTPAPRFRQADRQRLAPSMALDELLPPEHPARNVWEFVQSLDLSPLYRPIRAVEGGPGRSPIDPRILLALWLYATIEGVGSARRLDEFCRMHLAFRWLCGGVSVNYHTLADFRVGQVAFLDSLLTQSVAVLMEQNLIDLNRVAHDGIRVRASAGAASFRRRPTLEKCLEEAQQQVDRLRAELEADPAAASRAEQKARTRAAEERLERVRKAQQRLPELEAKKKAAEKDQARVSTTDPEATVMKMPDGGFRPAYNVQFSTATEGQVIVGVDVIGNGSDLGQLVPLVEQVRNRHGQTPKEVLADGGFAKHEDIETLSGPESDCTVYAPVVAPKDPSKDRYAAHPRDSAAVAAWRTRMATPEAQAIYKERAATAECVNALARNRGLQQFVVRGLAKVKAIVLWYAVAHNLLRGGTLRAAAAGLV